MSTGGASWIACDWLLAAVSSGAAFSRRSSRPSSVPWEMREIYTTAGERVLGKARYDNLRRFQDSTSVEIK